MLKGRHATRLTVFEILEMYQASSKDSDPAPILFQTVLFIAVEQCARGTNWPPWVE